MPEYVARLCRIQGSELVPFDTKEFSADNHDECQRRSKDASVFRSKNASVTAARRPRTGPSRQASGLGRIIGGRVQAGPA